MALSTVQFISRLGKSLAPLYYVCGDPYLTEVCVDAAASAFREHYGLVQELCDLPGVDYISLDVSASRKALFEELWGSTTTGQFRLVVARGAQHLTAGDIEGLDRWVTAARRRFPVAVILVSSLPKWPAKSARGVEDTPALVALRELFSRSECVAASAVVSSTVPEKSLVGLVTALTRGVCSGATARFVVAASSFEVPVVVSNARKVAVVAKAAQVSTRSVFTELSEGVVSALVERNVGTEFAQALFGNDKPRALAMAGQVDVARVLSSVEWHLDALARIAALEYDPNMSEMAVARRAGLSWRELRCMPYRKSNPGAVLVRRAGLVAQAYRDIGRPGVLEVLVALW